VRGVVLHVIRAFLGKILLVLQNLVTFIDFLSIIHFLESAQINAMIVFSVLQN